MNIRDAVTEAAENCDRNFSTEPCVVSALLDAIRCEREKVQVLREACGHVSYIPRILRALATTEDAP